MDLDESEIGCVEDCFFALYSMFALAFVRANFSGTVWSSDSSVVLFELHCKSV